MMDESKVECKWRYNALKGPLIQFEIFVYALFLKSDLQLSILTFNIVHYFPSLTTASL